MDATNVNPSTQIVQADLSSHLLTRYSHVIKNFLARIITIVLNPLHRDQSTKYTIDKSHRNHQEKSFYHFGIVRR